MEKAADAGEIVVSAETAALLPAAASARPKGPGRLLAGDPGRRRRPAAPERDLPDADQLAAGAVARRCARTCSRSTARPSTAHATAAFMRFEGTDALIAREGPEAGGRGAARARRRACSGRPTSTRCASWSPTSTSTAASSC